MPLIPISAGGTKGIGKACVEEFAGLGAKVHIILMEHSVKVLPNTNTLRLCNSFFTYEYYPVVPIYAHASPFTFMGAAGTLKKLLYKYRC